MPRRGSVESPEEKLNHCVRRILEGEGIPSFARHAEDLVAASVNPDSGAAQLARLVLKDLGLTTHLLRVANSSLYNRSGRRIVSVAHAIALLGWENLRNHVGALRFVEHFARRSPGLSELMTFSLVTAAHTREVAAAVGYSHPEEAFVCGLLRNLGEVLVASHFGRQYADVLLAMERDRILMRTAALRIFQFNFDDVGRKVAEGWNMPGQVLLCLGGGIATTNDQKCLVSSTAYGHELTSSLYRYASNRESHPVQLRTVVDAQGSLRVISPADLRRILESAHEDTRETLATLRIPVEDLRMQRQVERARHVLAVDVSSTPADLPRLDEQIRQAEAAMDRPEFEISTYIQGLLEILTDHGGFQRALFALLSEDRSVLRARLGSGVGGDAAIERFNFSRLRSDSLLHAVIHRKQDVFVDRRTDQRYDASQAIAALEATWVLALPVIVDDFTIALLYADRNRSEPDHEVLSRADRIRKLIAAAVARQRLGP